MANKNLIRRDDSREMAPRGSRFLPWSMDRLFDRLLNDFSLMPWNDVGRQSDFAVPSVDVCEDAKQVVVCAELPGMDEKDVEVSLSKDRLILQGEKKDEREEKGEDFLRHERAFGSIYREIELPTEVDVDHAKAEFKKGILTLTLPKSEEAQRSMKKIPIKAA